MTQAPTPTDPELELARQYGDLRGTLDGQRAALDRVRTEAYLNAYHGEMQAAGLCRCEEIATAQASPAPAAARVPAHPSVDLKALADQLSGFVVELSRIAAKLQPKLLPRGERVRLTQPDLASDVQAMLTDLGARVRTQRADVDAGRQVDADDTPAVPAQQALDEPGQDSATFVEVLQSPEHTPTAQGSFLAGLDERARQVEAAAEAELATDGTINPGQAATR